LAHVFLHFRMTEPAASVAVETTISSRLTRPDLRLSQCFF